MPAATPPPAELPRVCPREGCFGPNDSSHPKYHARLYHQENVTITDGPTVSRDLSSGLFLCTLCTTYTTRDPTLLQVSLLSLYLQFRLQFLYRRITKSVPAHSRMYSLTYLMPRITENLTRRLSFPLNESTS